ncbi:putative DNA helicase [Klebsiella pneumoniae subsp. ozaenae]|uniref:Putative DNA helicase n=1 Tax=Klebsiella pneumoniae subsp. ozaenae TaxID=574 RepID=A0A377Z2S6_KLEPO|nr:putative DNA helicase [Klebsiella pneumoniae subsp. ozaenae]
MSYSDTTEQAAVIGWSGHRLVVRAFAGTGQNVNAGTFCREPTLTSGCFISPITVQSGMKRSRSSHSMWSVKRRIQLAWPNFGRHYQERLTGNLRITDVARQLNTRHWPLARTAITTFNAFLCSGDSEFGPQHLPDEDARSGLSAEKILAGGATTLARIRAAGRYLSCHA